MQLSYTFTGLLATVLLATSVQEAAAAPLAQKMVTMPLKRMESRSGHLHPQILLQQRTNKAHKRLARMTGRAEPSHAQLRANIERRVAAIESSGQLVKRYNRWTPPDRTSKLDEADGDDSDTESDDGSEDGDDASSSAASSSAASSSAASSSAAAGTPVNSLTGDTSGQPFSQIDLNAIENPGGVTKATVAPSTDSLGLDIESNDVGYLATVQMGTPPQDYLLLMDSGSADLWVGSEDCVSEEGGGCGNHTFLGSQSSSTFEVSNPQAEFQVTYGTGNVQGVKISDDLVVAGLKLPNHQFGVATEESDDFSGDTTPFDGLMGLAQSTLSEQQVPTPIESLASAGLVSDAIVSFKIPRLSDQKNDGEITFGGLDATKFKANTLVSIPLASTTGFWEGAVDDFSVDGKSLGLAGRTAILDTGTTLIVAPPADAAAVHAKIPGAKSDGQGGFTVPCTTSASFALTFGGRSFAIDPSDLAVDPIDPTDLSGDCVSGISSGEIGGATEWLVGDVFLKNVYFSTKIGAQQSQSTISLAELA